MKIQNLFNLKSVQNRIYSIRNWFNSNSFNLKSMQIQNQFKFKYDQFGICLNSKLFKIETVQNFLEIKEN
jgi:hypothetical protein